MSDEQRLRVARLSSFVSSIFLYIPFLIGLLLSFIFSNESFAIWGFGIGSVLYCISYCFFFSMFREIEIEEQEKSLEEKKDF